MQALTFHGKETIRYETIADPTIEAPGDVIVRVSSCAICGSDLHPYFEREKGLDHGCAMGHEFTGEIVEKGKVVQHLSPGDRVMSPFTTNCGSCFYCRIGLTSRCEHGQLFGWRSNGAGLHGGQAEYVRVPLAETTLVKMPEDLPDEIGLLLGDILSTGYFCAAQAAIAPKGTTVVVGCGPVGLMAIWAARQLGAGRLFAVDAVPGRLQMAAAWGAEPIDFSQTDPIAVIREATQGRGADAVLEVVGAESAVLSAFELLRPGGALSSVGVCTSDRLPFSPVAAYDRNLTYRVGRCPARHFMEPLLDRARKDAELLQSVFTHRLPLSQGAEGYRLFSGRQEGCMKVLLQP